MKILLNKKLEQDERITVLVFVGNEYIINIIIAEYNDDVYNPFIMIVNEPLAVSTNKNDGVVELSPDEYNAIVWKIQELLEPYFKYYL